MGRGRLRDGGPDSHQPRPTRYGKTDTRGRGAAFIQGLVTSPGVCRPSSVKKSIIPMSPERYSRARARLRWLTAPITDFLTSYWQRNSGSWFFYARDSFSNLMADGRYVSSKYARISSAVWGGLLLRADILVRQCQIAEGSRSTRFSTNSSGC